MKRIALAGLCGLAVLAVIGLWYATSGPGQRERPAADSARARTARSVPTTYARPGFFDDALRGQVIGENGPVADASVLLIQHRAGTIAAEPCPCDPEWGPYEGLLDEFCECREADHALASMLTALAGESPVIAGDTTDDGGAFAIAAPPPGRYTLFAEHATVGAGLVSGVTADTDEDVEILLEPAAEFTGEVLDDFEEPLADARVVALDISTGRVMETASDEAGEFCFSGVHDSNYYVVAEKAPYFPAVEMRFAAEDWIGFWLTSPRQIAGLVKTPSGGAAGNVAVTLRGFDDRYDTSTGDDGRFGFAEVEAGEYYVLAEYREMLAGKLITVEPGRDRQRVVLELEWVAGSDLVGVITNDGGEPIAGARVRVEGDETWGTDTATTDDDGRYHVRPLAPGEYDVTVDAPGHGQLCGWVEIMPDQTTELDVALQRGGVVRGVVQTADGEPVADAFVSFELDIDWDEEELADEADWDVLDDLAEEDEEGDDFDAPDAFVDGELCFVLETTTRADGSFVLDRVAAGAYEISVEHDGPSLFSQAVVLPDEHLEIILPSERVLEGQVIDAEGSAVPFAVLSLRPADGIFRTYAADEEGDFEIPGITNGDYVLTAEAPDGTELRRRAELTLEVRGRLDPVLLELEPGYHLSGRVLDPDGYDVEAALIILVRSDGAGHHVAARDGSFELEGLPAGEYLIEALASGMSSPERRLTIDGDRETTVNLVRPAEGEALADVRPSFAGLLGVAIAEEEPPALHSDYYLLGGLGSRPTYLFADDDIDELDDEERAAMREALAALDAAGAGFDDDPDWREDEADDEELDEGWDDIDLWGEDAEPYGIY